MGTPSQDRSRGIGQRTLDPKRPPKLELSSNGRGVCSTRNQFAKDQNKDFFASSAHQFDGNWRIHRDIAKIGIAHLRRPLLTEGVAGPIAGSPVAGGACDLEEPHSKSNRGAFHRTSSRFLEVTGRSPHVQNLVFPSSTTAQGNVEFAGQVVTLGMSANGMVGRAPARSAIEVGQGPGQHQKRAFAMRQLPAAK